MENDAQRGDLQEGRQVDSRMVDISTGVDHFYIGNHNGKRYYVDWAAAIKDHPELQHSVQNGEYCIVVDYIVDWLIYCMTYVNSSMDDLSEIYKTIKKLGYYSVVVTEFDGFIKQIEQSINLERHGLVLYTDGEPKDPFMKRKDIYCGQSEYRFATVANRVKTKTIQIGQVSGFICESKDIDIIEKFLR